MAMAAADMPLGELMAIMQLAGQLRISIPGHGAPVALNSLSWDEMRANYASLARSDHVALAYYHVLGRLRDLEEALAGARAVLNRDVPFSRAAVPMASVPVSAEADVVAPSVAVNPDAPQANLFPPKRSFTEALGEESPWASTQNRCAEEASNIGDKLSPIRKFHDLSAMSPIGSHDAMPAPPVEPSLSSACAPAPAPCSTAAVGPPGAPTDEERVLGVSGRSPSPPAGPVTPSRGRARKSPTSSVCPTPSSGTLARLYEEELEEIVAPFAPLCRVCNRREISPWLAAECEECYAEHEE